MSPPVLVGRDELLASFADALSDGVGGIGRATLYTGARGSGKTVMLNAVEDHARSRGWQVISETATPGFVERISRQHLPQLLRRFDPEAVRRRFVGFSGPLNSGSVSWEQVETHLVEMGLRNQIELLTDVLAERETGLLITIDEVHRHQVRELRELAVTVQHAFREGRELAFVGAGLGSAVNEVLNDDVLTFLRRADRHVLGSVSLVDVEKALREPIENAGRTVSAEALQLMVEGTRGYPFLVQLVGERTWRVRPNADEIEVADAVRGVADAYRRMGALVHAPALAVVSDIDKSFLLAMAKDEGPSKMSEVQQRLGVDVNYASQYRRRLIAAELIEPAGYGYVDFAVPYLRDYLREHAVADV